MTVIEQTNSAIVNLSTGNVTPIDVPPEGILITVQPVLKPDDGSQLFQELLPQPHEIILQHLILIHSLLRIPLRPSYAPISLILSPTYSGVAFTSDSSITLSTKYVAGVAERLDTFEKRRNEISGVLLHELVHVVQNDGEGTAPGWWIEGLADWIRYEGGLGAAHWKKMGQGNSWKDAYDTTAMFLVYLASHLDTNPSVEINKRLGSSKWDDEVWKEITGKKIDTLWDEYKAFYSDGSKDDAPPAVPTHSV